MFRFQTKQLLAVLLLAAAPFGAFAHPVDDASDIPILSLEETRVYLDHGGRFPAAAISTGDAEFYVSTDDDAMSFPTNEEELQAFLEAASEEAMAAANANPSGRSLRSGEQPNSPPNRGLDACGYFQSLYHQIVYLKFPIGKKTFQVKLTDDRVNPPLEQMLTMESYEFSDEDKEFILERIENDYDGFDIDFVLEEPAFGCEYAILDFELPAGTTTEYVVQDGNRYRTRVALGSVVHPRRNQVGVDFRNQIKADYAWVNPDFWKGVVQTFDDPAAAFTALSGIPINDEASLEDSVREATINSVAGIGAHELGHLLGLRHHDSFGAPGEHPGFQSNDRGGGYFVDVLPARSVQRDTETFLHIMSTPAIGRPLSETATSNDFFSERSAIKLLLGLDSQDQDVIVSREEAQEMGGTIGSATPGMQLKQFIVPNTILQGKFAGELLATSVMLILGNMGQEGAHHYRFQFSERDVVTAEGISFGDVNVNYGSKLFSGLTISKEEESAGGELTALYTNHQNFEDLDPLLFDFQVPETGTYVLSIFPTDQFCSPGGACQPNFPIFQTGDYSLLVYTVDAALGSRSSESSEESSEDGSADDESSDE